MGGARRELKGAVLRRGGEDRDALVEHVVREVCRVLMSSRLCNTLRITVECRATTLASGKHGKATWTPVVDARSKHYRIVLRRDLDEGTLVRTIAHELRHVEQYARGRLRHGTKGRVGGRFWRPDTGPATFHPYASTDYRTSPWEVEAREAEPLGATIARLRRSRAAREERCAA